VPYLADYIIQPNEKCVAKYNHVPQPVGRSKKDQSNSNSHKISTVGLSSGPVDSDSTGM